MFLELKKLRDFDDGKKILIDETYFVSNRRCALVSLILRLVKSDQ